MATITIAIAVLGACFGRVIFCTKYVQLTDVTDRVLCWNFRQIVQKTAAILKEVQ